MLKDREACTGCFACLNACPVQCIEPVTDTEGFMYPSIDWERCTGCGKCEEACRASWEWLHISMSRSHPKAYAAWAKDVVLLKRSSSGGMFGVLAQQILASGGVVFGAAYDSNLSVHHVSATGMQDVRHLHGAKYVQSFTGLTYRKAKEALEEGRRVLYSGTPCQIAGLYGFLGHDHRGLVTCDIVCHGVPSPGVYREYLHYLESEHRSPLAEFQMRPKDNGWGPDHPVVLVFSDGTRRVEKSAHHDPFLNGFLFNAYLRRSCYKCEFARLPRASDLTLGDYWGLGRDSPFRHDTTLGVSLMLVNTEKGFELAKECTGGYNSEERPLQEATAGNSRLVRGLADQALRESFFRDYRNLPFRDVIQKHLRRRPSVLQKATSLAVQMIGRNRLRRLKQLMTRRNHEH